MVTALHKVVVHAYAVEMHLEVVVRMEVLYPSQFPLFISVANMPCFVIATDLEVAAILAEAHRELALLDDLLLEHHVVNRLKSVQIHSRFLRAESKDPVSILRVEVLGLCVHAAEGIGEGICPSMIVLAHM